MMSPSTLQSVLDQLIGELLDVSQRIGRFASYTRTAGAPG